MGEALVIDALRDFTDRVLGRGSAAITVPPFDGALKPNQILENAEVVAELDGPEDLATAGGDLFVAQGSSILRLHSHEGIRNDQPEYVPRHVARDRGRDALSL